MPRLRVLQVGEEVLVIVCDAELLGREFREGKLVLKVDEKFYQGREASLEECMRMIREATIANLVGSVVERAISEGLIDPKKVVRVQGVPHAMMVKMK
ncbi:MAG: DUF424 family protein [Candidatus Hadarchaeales archaeon]